MNLDNRKYLLYGLVLFTSLLFVFRLLYMQVIDDSWTRRATQIAEKRREIIPPRGIIVDRKNRKIVVNKISYNLMVTHWLGSKKSKATVSRDCKKRRGV
jgi:penicillin-binding protein 2